ncbi:transglycosylase domain-containing protein [Thalassospira sp.]|uniref:transglycosylase domain-containing protein n=1 Tax=Thalassospira sp. TaxID=1912094 RepID=UPI002734EE03|nr:transglycosylase domain-containing protein [Thalassospira sp.]MDP2700388.1 transglycosylase domain-containing protein [Thalassospira sp.]
MAENDEEPRRGGANAAQSAMHEIEERRLREYRLRRRKIRAAVTIIALTVIIGTVTAITLSISSNLDLSRNMLRSPEVRIVGYDGSALKIVKGHYSQDVSLTTIPERVQDVFVAAADPRFYEHAGVSASDFVRIFTGDPAPGSTITMQAARSFFAVPGQGTGRNLQELLVALWLEFKFSKKTILRSYLERKYVGSGIFGISAAARIWFGAPAERLTLHQAAVLAAAMADPVGHNPLHFPKTSAEAANVILQKMAALRMLEVERMSALTRLLPQLDPQIEEGRVSEYLINLVMDQVAERVGYTSRDLEVRTSIDVGVQMLAQDVVRNVSAVRLQPLGATQAALLAISPDGRVRAMVGGTSYQPMSRNRAWDVRHYPGSMIKLLPYYYALNQNSDPVQWVRDNRMAVGGWRPVNPDRKYLGQISLREAFVRDVNTVPANLTDQFGLLAVKEYARKIGIDSPLSNDIRTVVGLDTVTLPDIARLHALPQNSGKRPDVTVINSISAIGFEPLLYQRIEMPSEKLLTDEAMQGVNVLLASVTDPQLRLDRPFAGYGTKAGGASGAWYSGFTSDLVVVAWAGNDDNSPAPLVRGDVEVASMWRLFMLDAHDALPIRSMVRASSQRRRESDGVTDMWKASPGN